MLNRNMPWLVAALALVGCTKNAEHPEGLGSATAVATGEAAPTASAEAAPTAAPTATPEGTAHAAAEHAHPAFGYSGSGAPEHWGDLATEWKTCKTGTQQSPIDLPKGTSKKADAPAKLTVDYKAPLPLVVVNTGYQVKVEAPSDNSITVGGARYDLLQFHMHSPSEHTVAGKHLDFELHLVHKSAAGQLAVLGIMFDKGASSGALGELMGKLPQAKASKAEPVEGKPVDIASLVSLKEGYWHYPGSLTTPPCSEGVLFFIQKKTLTMTEGDIAKYVTLFGGSTSRPVYPLGDRKILDLVP